MSDEVFSRRSSVFFVCGGVPNAGGCTLEYVIDNSNNGFADFDKSLIMEENGDPIATSNAASYNKNTGRVVCNSGEFEGAEVGMILYIEGADFDSPGRYEITAVGVDEVTIETGLDSENEVYNNTVNIGGSFNTLSNALDNITADDAGGKNNCYLFTNHNEVVTARPQISGGGNIAYNSKLFITGFNTTLLDMMPGGTYYQSIYDAWKNGIDSDCHVVIDLDDIEDFYYNANCIITQNLRITNCPTSNRPIELGSNIDGLIFNNCIIDNGYNLIYSNGYNTFIFFINCYMFDSTNSIVQGAGANPREFYFIGCILDMGSVDTPMFLAYPTDRFIVTGCLLIGGKFLFASGGDFVEWNNTFVGHPTNTDYVHWVNNTASFHVGWGGIFVIPQSAIVVNVTSNGGCSLFQDFCCLWGSDDAEYTGTYSVNDKSGGAVSRRDFNTIDIDPELDSNYRPRNPQVLRGGIPQLSDGLSQLGAIKQKYQFPQKGRTVNHGRLGILK